MCSVGCHGATFLYLPSVSMFSLAVFFFNDTATTEIYTLSLHDALPISPRAQADPEYCGLEHGRGAAPALERDRKSTRLNSSHGYISYAVFCLKKKNTMTHARRSDHTAFGDCGLSASRT